MSAKKHIFTQTEKSIFMVLLKKHAHIIENKCTDGASLDLKKQAWTKLTSEYNASPHVHAQMTRKQLRRLWMNIKQRQRDAIRKARLQRLITGGDINMNAANIDDNTGQIASVFVVGNNEAIDSDTTTAESALPLLTSSLTKIQLIPSPQPFNPCPSTSPTSQSYFQQHKNDMQQLEQEDSKKNEIHELEKAVLREKFREAKARADMAELLLEQQRDPAAAASNARARVITEEFAMRQENYRLARRRDDELHHSKLEEQQLLTKAAKDTYLKCQVERESAEVLLKCNKAKRDEAELRLSLIKGDL